MKHMKMNGLKPEFFMTFMFFMVSFVLAQSAWAQQPAPAGPPPPAPTAARPFEILDNSFLVEEAFNQIPSTGRR